MKQLIDTYKWKALTGAVVLLFLYLVVGVVIPGFSGSWNTYQQLQMQQQKIDSADNWQQKRQRFNNQEEKLSGLYKQLFVSIPRNDQMSAIINLLVKQADDTEVTIREVVPLDRVDQEAFTLIPMDLKIKGEFHELLEFINGLEQANYLVRCTRLSMSAPKEYGESVLSASLRLSVTVIQDDKESEVARG